MGRRLNEELQAKTASLLKEADSFIMVSVGKCRARQQLCTYLPTYLTPHLTTLHPYYGWEGALRALVSRKLTLLDNL